MTITRNRTSKYGDLTPVQYYKLHPDEIPPHVHATAGGYNNYGCRCQPCTQAHSEAMARAKERRLNRPIPEHVHGTSNGYGNYGCRCRPCTDKWSEDTRNRMARARARKKLEQE